MITPAVQNQQGETVMSSDSVGMAQMFNVEPTFAGTSVTPQSAMRVSAVYACVRLIAGAKASMPVQMFQRQPGGTRTPVDDHMYLPLLNEEPAACCSAAVFWEYIESSRQLHGDGYAYIVRNRNGVPQELIPLHPLRVAGEKRNNRIVYYVAFEDGSYRGIDQDDMLHFCNFGWDGVRSMSTIRWGARNSIGTAIAAENHSGKFFKNGVIPSVVLEYEAKMPQEVVEQLRAEFINRYSGGDNAHAPLILTGGTKAQGLSISATDAQLLETRAFQVTDIARAFGVPPFMIGESEKQSSWGAGMSTMSQAFINYTLQPHLVRDEQEINRKLFRIGRYIVEFDRRALLRGDLEKLGAYYRQAIGGSMGPGWLTIDEVRKYENFGPIDGGAELYSPTPTQGATSETKPAA
ncbi:phage portal protein [Caballeronia sp. dw_276]|uniref:phage portal protein n=1 Tax=Caballeronia sp. dw_276 TaxID=2719795 RepID=UPI001BD47F0A|nr:phage portal protein [Caballeronia sp. dw_276]